MAGYSIIRDINDTPAKQIPISTLAVEVGDLLELVAGATTWTATATASNYFTRKAIAMEAAVSGDSSVLAIELDGTETIRAESNATASADHNGDLMDATDENTVNNDGTTVSDQSCLFVQDSIGPGTTEIIGRILVGKGVDPDVT